MTVVKICGLCTTEHALAAATAGAHLLGLVFAASRRQVTSDQARTIVTALRRHEAGQHVRVVGLFVNERPSQINAIAEYCGLDYVQLSGDETPEHAVGICRPIIKSLRLNATPEEDAWLVLAASSERRRLDLDYQEQCGACCDFPITFAPCPLIVDAHVPGAYGGTGVLADWNRAARLAHKHATLMLAGGLTPDNVVSAIQQVRPWGVDVSSGVETQGTKNVALIESFIGAVRSAI